MAYHLSLGALRDIRLIWRYTLSEWGEAQADRYVDDLLGFIDLFSETPLMFRLRFEYTPPIRVARFKSHLVLYNINNERVEVIRIVHGRQDITDALSEND